MRKVLWGVLAPVALLVSGCSGTTSAPPVVIGPHHGTLVKLPEERGYAEILNGTGPKGRAAGGRERRSADVLVYFLGADLKSPAAVSASDVSVKLTVITDQPTVVKLDPSADTADPLGKNRFASKIGPYQISDVHGELSATLDGQPFTAEFDGVR